MPIRDLTVLFQIIDKASGILDPILSKLESVDGSEIEIGVNLDPGQAAAQASLFESSLNNLQEASDKLTGALEKAAGAEQKEGKAADEAGRKTKGAGEAAKQASGYFQHLKDNVQHASERLNDLKGHLDGVKTKLLAIQATLLGMTVLSVLSSAKTERLVEELKGVQGTNAEAYLSWAEQGSGKAYTTRTQRLEMAMDLSTLNYSVDETKRYAEEIEKFYFQRTAQMQRFGISSAEELAKAFSSAEKGGEVELIKKLFSSGAISANSLDKEITRLRTNYEKFAFASDEVVKKQAVHNLIMKELAKTNKDFTGGATTLEQKLDVLGNKWNSFLTGIGDKLRPFATMIVDGLIKVLDTIESIPGHDQILIFIGLLIAAITTLISWVFVLAPALEALAWLLGASGVAGAAGTLAGLLGGLSGAIGILIGLLTGAAGALTGVAVAGAAAIAPLLPIIAVIAAIAAVIYLLYTRTTLLQDGFALLKEFIGRAMAAAQKVFSVVNGGLKGNKSDLQEIGTWIKNFLEGLIPGWLSDLFAQAQSIYREAMKWFDKIMNWWNSFLKKVTEVYDKIKSMLGLGSGEAAVTPEMQQYGVTGWTTVNGEKAVKVAYRELPTSEWNTPIYEQIRAATGGKTRLVGKEYLDFAQKYPELARAMTASGEIQVPLGKIDDYGIPESALPPEPQGPLALPDIKEAASDAVDEGKAAVQESGQTYVEKSSNTYKETLEKTGSYTAAAHAAYDPVGFYADIGGKGVNYLKEKGLGVIDYGKDLIGWGDKEEDEKLPAGAVGATIEQSGAMIVHEREELIPARIVEGTGKLGSLLATALNFMNGRADIEKKISEKIFSQQEANRARELSAGPLTVQVTIHAPVTVQISREMDLSKLDVNRLIDWSRVSYELEKIVRNSFRFQEG